MGSPFFSYSQSFRSRSMVFFTESGEMQRVHSNSRSVPRWWGQAPKSSYLCSFRWSLPQLWQVWNCCTRYGVKNSVPGAVKPTIITTGTSAPHAIHDKWARLAGAGRSPNIFERREKIVLHRKRNSI